MERLTEPVQSKELQLGWPCRLSPTIPHRVEATATLDAPLLIHFGGSI